MPSPPVRCEAQGCLPKSAVPGRSSKGQGARTLRLSGGGNGDGSPSIAEDMGLPLRVALSHLDLAVANVLQQTQGHKVDAAACSTLREHAAKLTRAFPEPASDVPASYSSRPVRRALGSHQSAANMNSEGGTPRTYVTRQTSPESWVDTSKTVFRSTASDAALSCQSVFGETLTLAGQEARKMALRSVFVHLRDECNRVDSQQLQQALAQEGVPPSVLAALEPSLGDGPVNQAAWFNAVDKLSITKDMLVAIPLTFVNRRTQTVHHSPTSSVSVPRLMLHHASSVRCCWDIAMTFFLLYLAFVLPFRYGFLDEQQRHEALDLIDVVVDWIFVADVFINFRTTYQDDEGLDVSHPWLVAKHYFRTWFVLDAVSAFPYDQVADRLPGLQPVRLLKLGKVSKVFRVLRIVRLARLNATLQAGMELLSLSRQHKVVVDLIVVLLLTFVMCHWVSCFMAVSGDGYLTGYIDGDPMEQYLAAFYWAMSTLTTVGYGDIIPTSNWERAYAILAMVVGCAFYGYILGNISFFVQTKNINDKAFSDRMGVVHSWLSYHSLPKDASRRILRHFKELLKQKAAVDEMTIMNDLSPELAKEVSEFLIPKEIRHAKIFTGLQTVQLSQVTKIIRHREAATDTMLVAKGAQGVGMFIVRHGEARLDYTGSHGWPFEQGPVEMYGGDSWGEEILVGTATHYEYSVQCTTPVALMVLPVDLFRLLFSRYRGALNIMKTNYLGQVSHAVPRRHRHRGSSVFAAPNLLPPRFADTILDHFDDISQRLKWLEFEMARPR